MMAEERVLCFDCQGSRLLGILAHPHEARELAVIIVVGGPQYRVGSHRQFVQLARMLATQGYPVLRFDVRGMGDSDGDARDFESLDDDIASAIDALMRALPSTQGVTLWGLCDGASAALMYVSRRRDPRVRAVMALNPWVRSEQSMARAHVKHYYADRLRHPEFWLKLLRGGVRAGAVLEFLRKLGQSRQTRRGTEVVSLDFRAHMARGCEQMGTNLHVLLSGDDYTAKEFMETVAVDPAWQHLKGRLTSGWEVIPEADHTFSGQGQSNRAEQSTLAFLRRLSPPA